MELIKMNYKGITLSVNPATIKTEMARSLAKKAALFSTSRVQDMCFEPTKISGSGYLVGANARCDAYEIIRTFKSKGSAYLFVPGFAPIRAFFSSLSIWYDSKISCVNYIFEFVEDCVEKKGGADFAYTYAAPGENLYDISNRTNVSVEDIFDSNDYKDLFSVKGGDKVWLS